MGKPAGGDRRRVGAEILPHPEDQRFHEALVAEDDARLYRMDSVGTEAGRGHFDRNGRKLGRIAEQGLDGGAESRSDRDALDLAVEIDCGKSQGGTEIHHDTCRMVMRIRRDGIAHQIGSDFMDCGRGNLYGQPVIERGTEDERGFPRELFDHAGEGFVQHRHDGRDYGFFDGPGRNPRIPEQGPDDRTVFVVGAAGIGIKPPVLDEVLAVKKADHNIGVSDIDNHQHPEALLA